MGCGQLHLRSACPRSYNSRHGSVGSWAQLDSNTGGTLVFSESWFPHIGNGLGIYLFTGLLGDSCSSKHLLNTCCVPETVQGWMPGTPWTAGRAVFLIAGCWCLLSLEGDAAVRAWVYIRRTINTRRLLEFPDSSHPPPGPLGP